MRRCAVALWFAFAVTLVGVIPAVSKEKPAGALTIEYHGQSMYIITTTKGKRIAFDPHEIDVYQRNMPDVPQLTADIVCISHNHNDHTKVEVFKSNKNMKVLRGLKGESNKANWADIKETIGDIKIRNVKVYHDDSEGFVRGKNSVFIVEVDGWRICHLGDLGHMLTTEQLKAINKDGPIDVLMIPVGGIYTINGAEAKAVVKQIKPREYVFPMHYGTDLFDYTLTSEEFLDGQDKRHVAISDDNVVKLNKDASRPRPLIVQLHYWPKEEKKVEKKAEKKK
jgi:L-ascorbate metabolism protein UlaG (beta-lactamase superfamily)